MGEMCQDLGWYKETSQKYMSEIRTEIFCRKVFQKRKLMKKNINEYSSFSLSLFLSVCYYLKRENFNRLSSRDFPFQHCQ